MFGADNSRQLSRRHRVLRPLKILGSSHVHRVGSFPSTNCKILTTKAGIKAITERTLPPLAITKLRLSPPRRPFTSAWSTFWNHLGGASARISSGQDFCHLPKCRRVARISSGQDLVGLAPACTAPLLAVAAIAVLHQTFQSRRQSSNFVLRIFLKFFSELNSLKKWLFWPLKVFRKITSNFVYFLELNSWQFQKCQKFRQPSFPVWKPIISKNSSKNNLEKSIEIRAIMAFRAIPYEWNVVEKDHSFP
jgi:hypothetical protein